MHRFTPIALVCLWGCVPLDVDVSDERTRFAAFPDTLFDALESVCSTPADTFTRPTQHIVECRTFLDPDSTAALILKYDGTLDKLPQLVMRFQAQAEGPEYLVKYDTFLNVPRRSGGPVKVIQRSPAIAVKIRAVMRHAGGVPEPAATPG